MIDHLSPELETRLRQTLSTKIDQLLDAPVTYADLADDHVFDIPLVEVSRFSPLRAGRPRATRVAIAGTLLAAAAATAGLAINFGRNQPEVIGSPSPTAAADPAPTSLPTESTAVPPTPTPASTTVPAPADPLARLSQAAGWYLPGYVPEGYELTYLGAAIQRESRPPGQVWVQRNAIGEPLALLSVWVETITPLQPSIDGSRTIHGQPAQAGDTGEGIAVNWREGDVAVEVRGLGLTEAETVLAAEAFVIDPATSTARPTPELLPEFELAIPATIPEGDRATVSLGFQSRNGPNSEFISVSVGPNTQGTTLDTTWVQFVEEGYAVETVGNKQLLVRRDLPDGYGPFTTVIWFDGDMSFNAVGRAPSNEIVALAANMAPATYDAAVALGQGITSSALTLDAVATAMFEDGVVASIRGRDGNPYAVCVEQPVVRCSYQINESFLGGAQQTALAQTFDVDGRQVLIAWFSSPQSPELTANTSTPDPNNPPPAITSATIKQILIADTGQFIEIDVPTGEQPPELRLNEGSGYSSIIPSLVEPDRVSF